VSNEHGAALNFHINRPDYTTFALVKIPNQDSFKIQHEELLNGIDSLDRNQVEK